MGGSGEIGEVDGEDDKVESETERRFRVYQDDEADGDAGEGDAAEGDAGEGDAGCENLERGGGDRGLFPTGRV